MPRAEIIKTAVLESIAYGFFGTVHAVVLIVVKESWDEHLKQSDGLVFGENSHGVYGPALLWMLVGFSLAAFAGRVFASGAVKRGVFYWLAVQTAAALLAILSQEIFLIFYNANTGSELASLIWWDGFGWMINLFLMLTPFTIAFAFVSECVKTYRFRNSLK